MKANNRGFYVKKKNKKNKQFKNSNKENTRVLPTAENQQLKLKEEEKFIK